MAILNSCDRPDELGEYALILAWGRGGFETRDDRFEAFEDWFEANRNHWMFGVLSYDLKNGLEPVSTRGIDELDMPSISVFAAERLVVFYRDRPEIPVLIEGDRAEFEQMCAHCQRAEREEFQPQMGHLRFRESRDRLHYLDSVSSLLEAIARGDVYELNLCRQLTAEISPENFDPEAIYLMLCARNPSAQSVFFRDGAKGLISASPERFLIKKGKVLSSQPIKGTAPRNADPILDQAALEALLSSPKERAENIMVVDLVRDDFAKIALPGSLEVLDLCAHRSLSRVHQMYSTIRCRLQESLDFVEIVKACFPMASMTGMPKIAAMEHADRFEGFRRAWYSGSFFYRTPTGDFDANVVIRSLVYRLDLGLASLGAGGAITALSLAEDEWRETEHKALSVIASIDATVTPVTSAAKGSA